MRRGRVFVDMRVGGSGGYATRGRRCVADCCRCADRRSGGRPEPGCVDGAMVALGFRAADGTLSGSGRTFLRPGAGRAGVVPRRHRRDVQAEATLRGAGGQASAVAGDQHDLHADPRVEVGGLQGVAGRRGGQQRSPGQCGGVAGWQAVGRYRVASGAQRRVFPPGPGRCVFAVGGGGRVLVDAEAVVAGAAHDFGGGELCVAG